MTCIAGFYERIICSLAKFWQKSRQQKKDFFVQNLVLQYAYDILLHYP